jgi:hypothetical protein
MYSAQYTLFLIHETRVLVHSPSFPRHGCRDSLTLLVEEEMEYSTEMSFVIYEEEILRDRLTYVSVHADTGQHIHR